MRGIVLTVGVTLLAMALLCPVAGSHCQIPCGIYGDSLRFELMREDVRTIEKSMREITRLSGEENINYNQLVRWIDNKEDHAVKLTEIATYYFLAQRVAPGDDMSRAESAEYMRQLRLLHMIVIEAMKTKQTVDTTHCDKLRQLISDFQEAYTKHSH